MKKQILLFLSAACFSFCNAQPAGFTDTSFQPIVVPVVSFAIQSDGKILTQSGSGIRRWTENGKIDKTFSEKFILGANVIQVTPDDKIIVAGASQSRGVYSFFIDRFQPDGTTDLTFNAGKKLVFNYGDNRSQNITQIITQPDGKMLLAGWSIINGIYSGIVVRINNDGSFDQSLNGTGILTTPFGGSGRQLIALQTDGKIIVVGIPGTNPQTDFVITRYNQDGTVDDAFGKAGMVAVNTTDFQEVATGVVVDDNGKIIVIGSALSSEVYVSQITLLRLNPDGSLDKSFSDDGIAFLEGELFNESAASIVVQDDHKIIIGGGRVHEFDPITTSNLLARFTPNGKLDLTFHGDGILRTAERDGGDGFTQLQIFQNKLFTLSNYGIQRFIIYDLPEVTLTSPTINNFYLAPATIRLVATATSPKDKIQKVEFYDGNNLITTEYNAPYDWYWRKVPAGTYNIMAKASDTKGTSTGSDVLQVQVITPTVNEFILMNATTNKRVMALYDGIVLDKSALPAGVNVKAITNFKRLGSVVFLLDGKKMRTENGYPYSLAGDSPSGDYHAWDLPLGTHTLTAVPYNVYSGGGTAGYSLTITFTVVNSTTNLTTSSDKKPGEENLRFGVYPNPANGILNVSVANFVPSASAMISILALDGSVIKSQRWNGQSRSAQVNVSSLPAGTYLVRINDGKKTIKKIFVKM